MRNFAGHFLAVVVGRKRQRKRARLAGPDARRGRLEVGQHAPFADIDRKVLRLTAGKGDTIDRASEIDNDSIAGLRGARGGRERCLLLAQHFERAIDVRRGHFRFGAIDHHARHIGNGDFGIHLEHRREFQRFLRRSGVVASLDPRVPCDTQVLGAHRIVERFVDGVRYDVRTDLLTILLRHHLERHLARTKAGNLRSLGKPGKSLLHLAFDLRDGYRDVQASRELAERFHCGLHASTILARFLPGN